MFGCLVVFALSVLILYLNINSNSDINIMLRCSKQCIISNILMHYFIHFTYCHTNQNMCVCEQIIIECSAFRMHTIISESHCGQMNSDHLMIL